MNNQNDFCWGTTRANDNKYLYLSVMRDLKSYCEKGYCEIPIVLYRFVSLPNSLIKRELAALPPALRIERVIVDWNKLESVASFMKTFFMIVAEVNHVKINNDSFNLAMHEFTQYIKSEK